MKLDVVYISDDNFAANLGVSIISLLEKNLDLDIDIHIIDMGISDCNISKIKKICKNNNRNCFLYNTKKIVEFLENLQLRVPVENNSVATLGRLYLYDILPHNIDKVLYLDCDILVNGSLKSIAEYQFKTSIAAVKDFNYKFAKMHLKGINSEDYINAGVLLINLEKFGKKIKSIDVKKLLSNNYWFADQDILNIIFMNDCSYLPPIYNSSSRVRMVKPKNLYFWLEEDKNLYTEKEMKNAYKIPVLIHFTSSLLGRPWENNCIDPQVDKWRKIYMKSPWEIIELKKKKLSFSNKMGRLLYIFFPQKIYCLIDKMFAEKKYKG